MFDMFCDNLSSKFSGKMVMFDSKSGQVGSIGSNVVVVSPSFKTRLGCPSFKKKTFDQRRCEIQPETWRTCF